MLEAVKQLAPRSRKQLIQLACVAAWSDLEVAEAERDVIVGLAADLGLTGDDMEDVRAWLDSPPPDFDPQDVPRRHRALFLDTLARVIAADGRIDPEECETLRILGELVE